MCYHSSYEKAARLYDLFDNKPNIDFFCRHARGAAQVLDIGAGTGRIAIPLANRGVKVCCLEPSPAMRAVFIGKLRENTVLAERVLLVAAEVSSFALKSTFPLAIMSGVFDHLLHNDVRLRALHNIRDHLTPKGTLAFDCFVGHPEESPLVLSGDYTIGHKEYRRYVGTEKISEDMREVRIVFEIHERGEPVARIEENGLVGVVNHEQVLSLLARTGFTVINEYGDFDCRQYQSDDELLIIEAQKE